MAADNVPYVEEKEKSFRLYAAFQLAELSVIVVRLPPVKRARPAMEPTESPPPVMFNPPANVEVAVVEVAKMAATVGVEEETI